MTLRIERRFVFYHLKDYSKYDVNDTRWCKQRSAHKNPKFKKHKASGDTVYVVTSRYEKYESSALETPHQKAVQEFLDDQGLNIDGIYFTNGQSKINKLLELGSTMHHDDDPGDIIDAKANDIEAIISDPYGDYGDLEASEIKQREQEPEEELTEYGAEPAAMAFMNIKLGKKIMDDD